MTCTRCVLGYYANSNGLCSPCVSAYALSGCRDCELTVSSSTLNCLLVNETLYYIAGSTQTAVLTCLSASSTTGGNSICAGCAYSSSKSAAICVAVSSNSYALSSSSKKAVSCTTIDSNCIACTPATNQGAAL